MNVTKSPSPEAIDTPAVIRASGSGRASGRAEFAVFSLNVAMSDCRYTGAIDALDSCTRELKQMLAQETGLRGENIRTRQYRIGPEWAPEMDGVRHAVGYRAGHKIQVRVANREKAILAVAAVIQKFAQRNARGATIKLRYGLSRESTDRLAKEALAQAVEHSIRGAIMQSRADGGRRSIHSVVGIDAPSTGIFMHAPKASLDARTPLDAAILGEQDIKLERIASLTFAVQANKADAA